MRAWPVRAWRRRPLARGWRLPAVAALAEALRRSLARGWRGVGRRGGFGLIGRVRGVDRGRHALQRRDFARREVAPPASGQPGIRDRPDTDAAQREHRVPDRLAHLPHLAVASFANHHFEHGLVVTAAGRCAIAAGAIAACAIGCAAIGAVLIGPAPGGCARPWS